MSRYLKMRLRQRALTLIELLITIILVSILTVSIWYGYTGGFKIFYNQFTLTSARNEIGNFLYNIASELRQADSLTTAEQNNLIFTLDYDNNGANDDVQYQWSGTASTALNKITTVTVPVVNSVFNIAFSYYDANNTLLTFPVTASDVRLVSIDITVTDKSETFHLASDVRLRNI